VTGALIALAVGTIVTGLLVGFLKKRAA